MGKNNRKIHQGTLPCTDTPTVKPLTLTTNKLRPTTLREHVDGPATPRRGAVRGDGPVGRTWGLLGLKVPSGHMRVQRADPEADALLGTELSLPSRPASSEACTAEAGSATSSTGGLSPVFRTEGVGGALEAWAADAEVRPSEETGPKAWVPLRAIRLIAVYPDAARKRACVRCRAVSGW